VSKSKNILHKQDLNVAMQSETLGAGRVGPVGSMGQATDGALGQRSMCAWLTNVAWAVGTVHVAGYREGSSCPANANPVTEDDHGPCMINWQSTPQNYIYIYIYIEIPFYTHEYLLRRSYTREFFPLASRRHS